MKINGITWEIDEIQDRHDSNWVVWNCIGKDDMGNRFDGSVQGFVGCGGSEPDWSTLEIY